MDRFMVCSVKKENGDFCTIVDYNVPILIINLSFLEKNRERLYFYY